MARWREMEGPDISKRAAISPAAISDSFSSCKICRRVGSARALNTLAIAFTPIYLDNLLNISIGNFSRPSKLFVLSRLPQSFGLGASPASRHAPAPISASCGILSSGEEAAYGQTYICRVDDRHFLCGS